MFHDLDSVVSRSSAEAYPQSSLRVEEEVSLGPSTGPEHWNNVSVVVASTHPKVPVLLLSPPSAIGCDVDALSRSEGVPYSLVGSHLS